MQPLWRLQINSPAAIADSCVSAPPEGRARLPYHYFQREVDGKFEMRTTGGQAVLVDPLEVCSVIPCDPIEVQAMPRAVFVRRSNLPIRQRQARPPAFCYAPAHVLYAVKDRFGIARAAVRFLDDNLNEDDLPHLAPLTDDDQRRFQGLARRTIMPVLGPRGANYSADHGEKAREASQERRASAFIKSALARSNPQVLALAM
jgi:hypothetical protein